MSAPRIENGWLLVDCDAQDAAHVTIALGDAEPQPAFRDTDSAGQRVAKIRPPAALPSRTRVVLAVNGQPAYTGKTP